MASNAVAVGQRAATYLRASTGLQDVENQRPALNEIATQRELQVVCRYEEYRSAARRRPTFDAMMLDARAGHFDYLLVWSLDRLGRSMVGNLTTVIELDRLGVSVLSAQEPWLDTASTIRPLLIGIFGWVAEQERVRIAERTRAGLARARSKGVRIGRPPKELDVEQLRALRQSGYSFREIGRQVGAGATTVHRVLAADEVLLRAVPKQGSSQIDSKTPEPLAVDSCPENERKRNNDDGEDDEGDVDL